jgi:hypothetical protein
MKRQSIMDTYKEIKAAYSISYDGYEQPIKDKAYLVGIDDNGIMIVSMDFRDMRGLSDVYTVVASNSDQARVRYNSIKIEDAEGQRHAESFHP